MAFSNCNSTGRARNSSSAASALGALAAMNSLCKSGLADELPSMGSIVVRLTLMVCIWFGFVFWFVIRRG